jgi:hypothetical protein
MRSLTHFTSSLTRGVAPVILALAGVAGCDDGAPGALPTQPEPATMPPPGAEQPPRAAPDGADPAGADVPASEGTPLPGAPPAAPSDDMAAAPSPAVGSADAGSPRGGSPDAGAARPLDLLFVVDNSISMADKQALLGQVTSVLDRFVHPLCVDADGNQFPAPAPGADCEPGQRRQFQPVQDVHLGVISTSMGDGGANVACPDVGSPRFVDERIDRAHLLGTLPRAADVGVASTGFVSWRAGEDEAAASRTFASLVTAAGENGCGWEMPLEAWYRFLADPFPPAQLTRVACPGTTTGAANCVQPAVDEQNRILLDAPLLAQREAFLRPSSRLAIVMLTDENDCSLQIGDQNWVVLAIDDARPMFRGSSVCGENPNDPCCYSCPLGPPDGCAADPACATPPEEGATENRLPAEADGQNLRCFQQKRRFGVDFLYPVARYINALTQPELCFDAPDLALEGCTLATPNPLFAGGRSPEDVFLAGIVGVPSQLIEAEEDAAGRPAVAGGFRYKLAAELTAEDWNAMIGDGSASPPLPPASPFMVESATPRDGVEVGNAVNGREYSTVDAVLGNQTPDDLQYACILPLPEPRDCAALDPSTQACDCYAGGNDKPLCEELPGQSAAGTVQYWGKAYPGTRQLEVLRGLGARAVVGSICARNTTDAEAADFSYQPSIAALVDSMEASLQRP